MLSYRLWQAILQPPTEHPIFKLVFRLLTPAKINLTGCRRIIHILFRILIGLMLVLSACIFILAIPSLIRQMVTFILYTREPYLPLTLAFYVEFIAAGGAINRTAQFAARQRDQKTYELLCLLPIGWLSLNWLFYVGCAYYRNVFPRINQILRRGLMVIAVITALNVGLKLIYRGLWGAGIIFTYTVIPTLLIYMDFAQASVLANLMALLNNSGDPAHTVSSSYFYPRNWNWQTGLFLTLQLMIYLAGLMGAIAIDNLMGRNRIIGWKVDILLLAAGFGTVLAAREGVIWLMWRLNKRLYHAAVEELDFMTKTAAWTIIKRRD
jgi:hypothetical protein